METVSLLLWVCAVALLVIMCFPKVYVVPLGTMSVLFSAGGFISVINEFNAGALTSEVAVFLTIAMVSIMIYSLTIILNFYIGSKRVTY